jgi:TonB family protein
MSSQTNCPTVLLIDYEPKSIASFLRPLRDAGYQVEVANDGVAGLEAYERLKPDLVLVEAMLPKKHGFEVCQTIKQSHDGRGTPVLITTAVYKGRKYRNEALTVYGCDEYIEKPITEEHLLELCGQFLGEGSPRHTTTEGETTEETESEVTERPVPVPTGHNSPLSMLGDLTEEEIVDRLDSLLDGIQEDQEEEPGETGDEEETAFAAETSDEEPVGEEPGDGSSVIDAPVESASADAPDELEGDAPSEAEVETPIVESEVSEEEIEAEAQDLSGEDAIATQLDAEFQDADQIEEDEEPETSKAPAEPEAREDTDGEAETEPVVTEEPRVEESRSSLEEALARKRGSVDLTTHNVSDAVDNLFNELAAATDAGATGPRTEPQSESEEPVEPADEAAATEAAPFGPAPRPDTPTIQVPEPDEKEERPPGAAERVEQEVAPDAAEDVGIALEIDRDRDVAVATPAETETTGGVPRWIWPVAAVVVLGIGAALYFVVFGGGESSAPTRPAATTTAQVRTPPPTPASEPTVSITESQDAAGIGATDPVEDVEAAEPGSAGASATGAIDLSGGSESAPEKAVQRNEPEPTPQETRSAQTKAAVAAAVAATPPAPEPTAADSRTPPPAESEPAPAAEPPAEPKVEAVVISPDSVSDLTGIETMPVPSKQLETADIPAEQALMPAVTARAKRGDLVLIEEVDTAPIPVRKDPPAYHPLARRLRQEGDVTLTILVDHNGKVEQVEVASGIPKSKLNDSAVAAARKWVYSPAVKDGVPVRVWITETVYFRL